MNSYNIKNNVSYLISLLLLFALFLIFTPNLYSTNKTEIIPTLKEMYDLSTAQNGYDKYIELETGVVYSGGLLIGNIPNPLDYGLILGDNDENVKIVGNGAILDLQGSQIIISFCDNILDIENCVILNGNVRFVGDHILGDDYSPQGSVEYVTFYKPHDYGVVCLGAGSGITINRNIIVDAVDTGSSFQVYNGIMNHLMPTGISIVSSANYGTFGSPARTYNWSYHSKDVINNDLINHFTYL